MPATRPRPPPLAGSAKCVAYRAPAPHNMIPHDARTPDVVFATDDFPWRPSAPGLNTMAYHGHARLPARADRVALVHSCKLCVFDDPLPAAAEARVCVYHAFALQLPGRPTHTWCADADQYIFNALHLGFRCNAD